MKALGGVMCVVVGLLAASCGGDDENSAGPAIRSGCDEQGINAKERREGTCTDNGIRYTVVNRDSKLRTRELDARLVEVEQVKSIDGDLGSITAARGTFVIFRLAITNRLRVPTDFRDGQILLNLRSYSYPVTNHNEENEALEDSFVNQRDSKIQPGETRTGAVVFDIPIAAIKLLGKPGSTLYVLPFSQVGLERPERLGEFRLYGGDAGR